MEGHGLGRWLDRTGDQESRTLLCYRVDRWIVSWVFPRRIVLRLIGPTTNRASQPMTAPAFPLQQIEKTRIKLQSWEKKPRVKSSQ